MSLPRAISTTILLIRDSWGHTRMTSGKRFHLSPLKSLLRVRRQVQGPVFTETYSHQSFSRQFTLLWKDKTLKSLMIRSLFKKFVWKTVKDCANWNSLNKNLHRSPPQPSLAGLKLKVRSSWRATWNKSTTHSTSCSWTPKLWTPTCWTPPITNWTTWVSLNTWI